MSHAIARAFTGGWWPAGPKEAAPPGTLRRAKGVRGGRHHDGSVRSRWGADLIQAVDAHSLFRFYDTRFYGVGAVLIRDMTTIKTGLNGNPLFFLRAAPSAGQLDTLYVTGGGALFAVDSAGNVTNWGIAVCPNGIAAADAGAGGVLNGTYQYKVTFRNSTKGTRGNGNPTPAVVTVAATHKVNLSAIPVSADPQVNAREIWRTVGNGNVFFLLTTIADNVTTTFADNIADVALSPTELPDDNDAPYNVFPQFQTVIAQAHDARAWWISNINGERSRLYFSPVGRPESVEEFLVVSSDDDPLITAVGWNTQFYAFSESTIYTILGSGPYVAQAYPGVPGTVRGGTVVPTAYGVLYQANDGVRLFDGQSSRVIAFDAVGPLFHGEALEGVAAFEGTVAAFFEDEYIISNGIETLGLDVTKGTWRVFGLGLRDLYAEADTGLFIVSGGGRVLSLEAEGVTADGGDPIPFEVEWPSVLVDTVYPGTFQFLVLDLDTGGQPLTPTLLLDGVERVLPPCVAAGRQQIEWPVGVQARRIGVRLTGALTQAVTIYGIDAEVYKGAPDVTTTGAAAAA